VNQGIVKFFLISVKMTYICNMDLINELSWRGLIHDTTRGVEDLLKKEKTSIYIGFDPTSDSLHIGSLVPILLLKHIQRCGHTPIVLIGGATAMIGDPSGKKSERLLLSDEKVEENKLAIHRQLNSLLGNDIEIIDNKEWFMNMRFIEFARSVGKHITVSQMISKESVKSRIDDGLSFTEFIYQLMQAFDFLCLHNKRKCMVQAGGSDQWGNITTGIQLIRKKTGKEVFGFTTPLVTKSDGGKFGKTESGNIWIDSNKTSHFDFFQFWLNVSDEDAKKWIKMFTFLDKGEIEKLMIDHMKNPSERILQKILANEVTQFVHGEDGLMSAQETTDQLFSNKHLTIDSVTEMVLMDMKDIPRATFPISRLENGMDVVSLLFEGGIFKSKGESKRSILSGGVSINMKRVTDVDMKIEKSGLLFDKFVLGKLGKKKFFLINFE
jgi:tyrosyl-tRNA synthetase